MPLVKKQSGWYWGSKGPFDTKAQALAVARAAYASGYKEQKTDKISYMVDVNSWTPPSKLVRKYEDHP